MKLGFEPGARERLRSRHAPRLAGACLAVCAIGWGPRVSGIGVETGPGPAEVQAGAGSTDDVIRTIGEAERLLALGDRVHAAEVLGAALPGIEAAANLQVLAVALSLLGRAHLQLGQFEAALPPMQRALDLAEHEPIPGLLPSVLNDLGLLHVATHDDDIALQDFERGLGAAQAAGLPGIAARIRLNQADLHQRRGETALAEGAIKGALAIIGSLSPADRALIATGAASRWLNLRPGPPEPMIESWLHQAIAAAHASGDLRALSEAQGELGRAYERGRRADAALERTRQALFTAQAARAPELLYRWEWQGARLMAAQGKVEEALAFYGRATETLRPIRHDLLLELRASRGSYRDAIGPLFLEYADLLLKQAARSRDPARLQQNLRAARDVIEQMKTVHLEDYFQDDCAARFESAQRDIDQLEPGTAAIYPIVFPDRTELLLSQGGQLRRVGVPVAGKVLSDEALRFRKLLVKRGTEKYLESARRLHDWLIRPLLGDLESLHVDTLVIVPDGALLGIPFAALHDGRDFLIQRFAIATVPGLRLIEPSATHSVEASALLSGLSKSVQGFPALPSVDGELGELSQIFAAQRIDNEQFTVRQVEQAVDRRVFEVVHIASHGKFEADARKSFLLTYDGRMGMDSLERIVKSGRFREDPVDLLTLSACETAAGDERAALGLAGVAIKAGARSVVATLWFIDDEAASTLIRGFYRELRGGNLSKARALQAAQRRLLADARFRHPGYWAPFLVIGNWN